MIQFKCYLPEVLDKYPITKISKKDFNWVKKAFDYYKNNPSDVQTTRCPGIFSILETGWVQKAYQDIFIETNGDRESVVITTPYNQKNGLHGDILNDYVSWHPPKQLDVFKPMPSHTLKTLVKIQSPWKVVIPKDYYLLITSVPYNDEDVFTVAPGLLQGENFLNVQMFWHKLNGKHIIKKGTPLCYYLLIEKKKCEFKVSCIE